MLVDFENTGFINVHPSLCEEKNTYIPWGFIKGDIAEQSDLMELLTTIESGLTAEQIALLVDTDERIDEVKADVIELEQKHNTEISDINSMLNSKVDYNKIWSGTQAEWDALSAEQQNSYTIAMIEK